MQRERMMTLRTLKRMGRWKMRKPLDLDLLKTSKMNQQGCGSRIEVEFVQVSVRLFEMSGVCRGSTTSILFQISCLGRSLHTCFAIWEGAEEALAGNLSVRANQAIEAGHILHTSCSKFSTTCRACGYSSHSAFRLG